MNKEGKPKKQAVAMALNMQREGRLTSEGEYKPVKKSEGSEEITLSKEDLEDLVDLVQKALSAGIGYSKAPTARMGSEAMAREALKKDPVVVTYPVEEEKKKKRKRLSKSVISLFKSLKEAYPAEDPFKLAEWVLETFIEKMD
jgi:hypothetical protein